MEKRPGFEILIGILAIISIILVSIEFLISLSWGWLLGIYMADLAICLLFAWDFVYRLRSAENKNHFLRVHGFEILAIIPAIALYAAAGLPGISAGLRSLRLIRVIRVVLMIARMRRVTVTAGRFVQRSRLITMLGIAVSVIFIGAFAVLVLESGTPDARIANFSDAVWWSISTVTTVGYGDIVPISGAGRIMGMLLMIVGIGVMAAFISQLSATLVESRMRQDTQKKEDLRKVMLAEVKSRIDNIDKLTDSEVSLLMAMIQSLRLKGGES